MNVCYLINQLAPGGAPTLLHDVVRRTEDPEIDYTVCFVEGDDSLVGDLRDAGAEVVRFDASFKFDPRALLRMIRFFNYREFDVLHAHLPYSQTLGRLVSRLGSVKTVVRRTEDPEIDYTVCFVEGDDSLVGDLRDAGAEVVRFDASFKFDPRALRRMIRFFNYREFDVLHAHLPYSQTLGRLVSRVGSVKTVVSTQHSVPAHYHPITRTLERATRSIDDATVAVSEGVERAFRGDSHRYDGTLDDSWCTIYNGVDTAVFSKAVEKADPATLDITVEDDALVYLNVSRYIEAKAQTDLIDAMKTVVEQEPSAHLFIVGWGPQEARLRERVAEHGLNDSVTITGRVPAVTEDKINNRIPSVAEYYALADVFVSSSVFEGMPITHIEAMAAGLPVVATDIPGVDEVVVDGETGVLVPTRDTDALAAGMLELTDPERRRKVGRAGHSRAGAEFDIERTVDAHISLYRSLCAVEGDQST